MNSPSKVYLVYYTESLVNGKFYIGVHKTSDEYDDYLGSGKILKASVKKYGRQHFRRTILRMMYSGDEAFAFERLLLEGARSNSLCMNIHEGGSGGFDYINDNGLSGHALGLACRDPLAGYRGILAKMATDPEFKAKTLADRSRMQAASKEKKAYLIGLPLAKAAWTGQTHTAETRAMMSARRRAQPPVVWVTNGILKKRVPLADLESYLSSGWSHGQKLRPPKLRKPRSYESHGTLSRYKKLKCRCADCRAANRDQMRRNRARHRNALALGV